MEEKGKKTILFFRSTWANRTLKRTKNKFEVCTKSPLFTQKADFFFYQGHIKWQFCEINFRAKSVESRDSSQNWKQMVTTKSQKWNQSHPGILAPLLGNCQQQSIHWRYHDWFLDQDRYLSGLLKCKKCVNLFFLKIRIFLGSQEFPLNSGFFNSAIVNSKIFIEATIIGFLTNISFIPYF